MTSTMACRDKISQWGMGQDQYAASCPRQKPVAFKVGPHTHSLTISLPYLTVFPVQDLEGLDIPRADALRQHFTLKVQLNKIRETPGGI